MKKEKVVLAFSGGLDTSFCAKYLTEDCGYELYTASAFRLLQLLQLYLPFSFVLWSVFK